MQIREAIDLIRFRPTDKEIQIWADLGCGTGVFTKALAALLPAGSRIQAIDVDKNAMRQIPNEYEGVGIETSALDFTSEKITFNQMDGIMMANSLHYVKDKAPLVQRIIDSLNSK